MTQIFCIAFITCVALFTLFFYLKERDLFEAFYDGFALAALVVCGISFSAILIFGALGLL